MDSVTTNYIGRDSFKNSYSINRAAMQKLLAARIEHFKDNIEVHYNTNVRDINLKESSFFAENFKGET